MLNILLVDNETIFAEALSNILQSIPGQNVLECVSNLNNVENLCVIHRPQAVLIRHFVSGEDTCFKTAGQIKKSFPEIKVIMILNAAKASLLKEAKLNSVDSCVLATAAPNSFHECLWGTMAGKHIYPEACQESWGAAVGSLSDKELQVIRLACQDFTPEEIAERMGLSKRTVSYHVKNILEKTGHKSMLSVVLEAVKKGYII